MKDFKVFNQPNPTNKFVFKPPRPYNDDSDYDSEEEADKADMANLEKVVAAEKLKYEKDTNDASEGIKSIWRRHGLNEKTVLTRDAPRTTYINRGPFTSNPYNTNPNKKKRIPASVGNKTGNSMVDINANVGLTNPTTGELIYEPLTGKPLGGQKKKRHSFC